MQGIDSKYDLSLDFILTYDFAVKHLTESQGGKVQYVDHLCDQHEMQENNFLASEFFKKWHYDKMGNDIFTEHGVPFGFAFRIETWTEYLFYVRLRANLEKIKDLHYETIYLGESRGIIENILREMGLPFVALDQTRQPRRSSYFFDMHKYMYDALHGRGFRQVARDTLVYILSNVKFIFDRVALGKSNKKTLYMQIYHPTKTIAQSLKTSPHIRLVTPAFVGSKGIRKYFSQRLIPIRGRKKQFQLQAKSLMLDFKKKRCASLCLHDGTDISAGAYRVIEQQIESQVAEALRILNSVIHYVEKMPIHLEIMIANLGLIQTIVDCVLKSKGVPSYLIINGLLGGQFLDEAKYATFINSYSESIKKHYFNGADNVVCLGDPRMDVYAMKTLPKRINREVPTVSIGTSGFGVLNLISYVAVEFDFMFDVLSAFQELMDEDSRFNLIIKVRTNGVLKQYADFAKEYFPRLKIEIVRDTPILQILNKTDLYISIYSQTLFEASCLGIPAIYYKKDEEILDPPFDQKSELVTVDTVSGLKQAFLDFQSGHNRFNAFLDKSIMEKYVGPLDGENVERNLRYIDGLLWLDEQREGK